MNRRERRAAGKRGQSVALALAPAGAAAFAAAVEHHQAGRLPQAEALYRQVLASEPLHADSLHLLGVIAHQGGQHATAADLIGAALAVDPAAAVYHSNLGNALQALGRVDDAIACQRRAIRLAPESAEAHHNLGAALRAQGRLEDAAHSLRRALALRPDFCEAHNTLGTVLVALGRAAEAVACYRRAIELRPAYPEAHNNLGAALMALGAAAEADVCYRHALALRPDFAAAESNLSVLHRGQGRLDAAIDAARRAIALQPDFFDAHANLAHALADQGELDAAAAGFRAALALRPGCAETHDNLAAILMEQGFRDAAIAGFRAAIARRPDFANAHHNLAMALLGTGDLAAGFAELEWRWQTAQFAGADRHFPQPRWRGEAGGGRTLLIHAEQGFGDTIQFCRYAEAAHAAGWRVILEVQPPLVRLLRSLAGVDAVLPRGEALPDFAAHCPMLSLPLAVGTTLATIPAAHAYLHAEAGPVAAWRARLAAAGDRCRRVGLAWAGSAALGTDRRRSLPPALLAPLLRLPGWRFYSLQQGRTWPDAGEALVDCMAEIEDFADTAALVANLDLVIAVDTAVAHLAAALGRPVWLLNRFDADWRWLGGRRDSPWYPTLRIYAQPRPGDWEPVLAEVARDLRERTQSDRDC